MTIGSHLTQFAGFEVTLWEPGDPLGDPATTIHRIAVDWEDERSWGDRFRAFLELPGVEATPGLVVGLWDQEAGAGESPQPVVEALVSAHLKLPNLRALFINDITYEECEVSWITNTDLSPVLAAYPRLEHLGIRGGNELSLGRPHLPELRSLIVQAGGLSAEVVREVMTADLPKLEHLELYLGTEDYGATSTPEDLTPLLAGTLFPRLKFLGLKNSDRQDEIAQIVAQAPVLEGLEELDLSLGTLTDEGAAALVASPRVHQLRKLSIVHHWCSDEVVEQLRGLGLEVDASEGQDREDDWRYVALGE